MMKQIRAVTVEIDGEFVKVVLTNGRSVRVPKSEFKPSGTGLAPDFSDVGLVDNGFGIRFGEYEANVNILTELFDAPVTKMFITEIRTAKGTRLVIDQYSDGTFDISDDNGQRMYESVALIMVLSVVRDQ